MGRLLLHLEAIVMHFFIILFNPIIDRSPRLDDSMPQVPDVLPHATKSSPIDLVAPVSYLLGDN